MTIGRAHAGLAHFQDGGRAKDTIVMRELITSRDAMLREWRR
jgi:hypothetical protein